MNKNTYRSIVTPKFRDMLAKLPVHIQKEAREGDRLKKMRAQDQTQTHLSGTLRL